MSSPYLAVEANLREAMRCYALATPQGEVSEQPGCVIASSGIDYAVFNSAMLTQPAEGSGLDRAIALADVHYSHRRLGWSFWLCEDLLHPRLRLQARKIFRGYHMDLVAQPPGMWTDALLPASRPLPLIETRAVCHAAARAEFVGLASAIFALPMTISERIYGSEAIWNSSMSGYVGYTDGRPYGVIVIVVAAGAAGVYSLGVLPEFRRRGLAEALMRRALADIDAPITVLQSTRQGLPLYTKMGYKRVSTISVYVRQSPSLR